MEVKKLQELLKLIDKHDNIAEFSLEEKSFKLHVKLKGADTVTQLQTVNIPAAGQVLTPVNNMPNATQVQQTSNAPATKVQTIKSPIVGSFYSKSSPDAEPFVKVGDIVKPGSIVCIIESMKIFNEVESEVHGTIKKVLLKDGSPVEHGQPLFEVE